MAYRLWGSQQLVNATAAGNQVSTSAAALAGGGYVVVWQDDGVEPAAVRFQRFDALGNKVGSEGLVASPFEATLPCVTALGDGGFVIGVNEFAIPGDGDTTAYRYSSGGNLVQISPLSTISPDSGPAFIEGSGGTDFVAAFHEIVQVTGGGTASRLMYRNSEGGFLQFDQISSSELQQYVHGLDYQSTFGRTAILYSTTVLGNEAVRFGIYDEANNAPIFGSLPVGFDSFPPTVDVSGGDIAWFTNDALACAYTLQNTVLGVASSYLRVVDLTGNLISQVGIGGAVSVNLTSLASGMVAVTYARAAGLTYLFTIDKLGNRIGSEIALDISGTASDPTVTELADGRLLVTWTSSDVTTDGDGTAILSQIVDPRDGFIDGSALPETLVGHNIVGDQIRGFSGNDTIYGLGGADSIYCGDGNDTANAGKGDDEAFGGKGDDTLVGASGEDDLYGEAGNDTLRGGTGADLLSGGGGTDTAEYIGATTGVQISIDGTLAATGEAAGDIFVSIERLRGSNFADLLRGDGGANFLIGENGNDDLQGQGGGDTLRGGGGIDTLTGGANADTFQYLAVSDGGDTITDFSAVDDRFLFQGTGFGGLPGGALAANRFQSGTDPLSLASSDVRFYYETDTRILWFDADGANGGAVAIATLQTGATMTAADIFIS